MAASIPASRKLLWLRIWVTNSDPKVIGRWYLEYLYEARIMPSMIRLDRGTETGTMATIHAFLRRNHDDMDDPCESIIYGPSTSNQVSTYLMLLAFLLIPVVQKELDLFRTVVWNSHKIRTQKDTALPDGIPDHIYNFPET
ncbi:unnamed protein product [Porites lobata]|uniref:Uncharacterized protein n=1 Tax=Porites lobata TaxID=104759 RepID=A0ABN8NJD3_9CNID|nr:unnamed protein product [Porites lobata]